MDQVYVVRHKVLVKKLPVRQVAREMGISRVTVKRYLDGAEPGIRKAARRLKPVTEKVRGRVEELLNRRVEVEAGKQRLTAKRLHRMLVEEKFSVGVWVVKELVREWRRKREEVFVRWCTSPAISPRSISSRCWSTSPAYDRRHGSS